IIRTATSRLEVWSSSQRVAARSYRARAASGQDAAREQDRADEHCHQHGAHDTEPFLVGPRVGDFALKNVAHRTTPSMIVVPSPVPATACVGKIGDNCGASDATSKKPGGVAFGSQKRSGSPRSIAGGPRG